MNYGREIAVYQEYSDINANIILLHDSNFVVFTVVLATLVYDLRVKG
mgnify:FL=1